MIGIFLGYSVLQCLGYISSVFNQLQVYARENGNIKQAANAVFVLQEIVRTKIRNAYLTVCKWMGLN